MNTIPKLTKEQFDELIQGKKGMWFSSPKITKNKTTLSQNLDFFNVSRIKIYAESKKAFVESIKEYAKEDFCAVNTSIIEFPVGQWIKCLIGDPFVKELCLVGYFENYFVFKTREGNIITCRKTGWHYTWSIQPAPN